MYVTMDVIVNVTMDVRGYVIVSRRVHECVYVRGCISSMAVGGRHLWSDMHAHKQGDHTRALRRGIGMYIIGKLN